MLITCFQCRHPLEAPGDSAGKRVRCPHCNFVIVVPAPPRRDEAIGDHNHPALALPPMELDDATTRSGPMDLPLPFAAPPPGPAPRGISPIENDLPSRPTIERNERRRVPTERRRRRFAVGTALIVLIGVILWSAARERRINHFGPNAVQIKRRPLPRMENPPPKDEHHNALNRVIEGAVNAQIDGADKPWNEFHNAEHRFKIQLPGPPLRFVRMIDLLPATVFEVQQGTRLWSVAHQTLSEKQYSAVPLADRFGRLEDELCDSLRGLRTAQADLRLKDLYPGREWSIAHGDSIDHIRCYFVRDGARYHQYILTASGSKDVPRREYNRFFDSFDVLLVASAGGPNVGQTLHEVLDDLSKENGRTNEYISMRLHPTLPLAVLGTAHARVKAVWLHGEKIAKPIVPHETQAIDQLDISADGRWLAVAVGGKIQLWLDWDRDLPTKKRMIPGLRCAFVKDHRLLVMSKDSIRAYDPETDKYTPTVSMELTLKDPRLEGFALSPDGRFLAVHAGKTISLWDWPQRRLVGRLEGHEAAIMRLAFAPDGATLASASADRTIRLWDVETCTERRALRQHAWTVWDLAFAPDGSRLASAGLDGMLLVWDLTPEQPRLVWAQSHQFPVRSVAWDRDGKNLYFTRKHPAPLDQGGSERQFTRALRKIPASELHLNPAEAERTVAQCAGLHLASIDWLLMFAPDGRTIVTTTELDHNVSEPRKVRLWDAATARVRFAEPARSGGALSPDGKWLLFSRPDGKVVLRLIEVDGNLVLADRAPLDTPTFPLAFFTADSAAVWVLHKHELLRYSLPALTLKQRMPLMEPNDERSIAVEPSPDRLTFVVERFVKPSGLRERTLHRATDGTEIPLTALPTDVGSIYWRMRQSDTNHVELEDKLRRTSQVIGQQRFPLGCGAIHPGGKIGATADSADGLTLRIHFWDLDEHRPIMTLPDSLARTATNLQFSPDGRWIAMTTSGGWTRIVPMDWLLERRGVLPPHPEDVGVP